MGPNPALLPVLAQVFYSMWSTNVIYAVIGVSAAAFIHTEFRDSQPCTGGRRCSEAFRIVGCLSRGKPPEKKDVWTVAKDDEAASDEERAIEPEVHNLTTAIERLRFKIDALALRRQAAAAACGSISHMALPPSPPPRIPSPPRSPTSPSFAPSETPPPSP